MFNKQTNIFFAINHVKMFERLIFDSDAVALVTVVFISKFRCLCTSSVQREIGQRNVQKSVMRVQNCCFGY